MTYNDVNTGFLFTYEASPTKSIKIFSFIFLWHVRICYEPNNFLKELKCGRARKLQIKLLLFGTTWFIKKTNGFAYFVLMMFNLSFHANIVFYSLNLNEFYNYLKISKFEATFDLNFTRNQMFIQIAESTYQHK